MDRKTGATVAAAVSLVLVAGAVAAGMNLGLLGSTGASQTGKLRPIDAVVSGEQDPQVITVEVKDPGGAATAEVVDVPAEQPVQYVDVPASAGSGVSGRSEVEDEDESEDEDEDAEDHAEEPDGAESDD